MDGIILSNSIYSLKGKELRIIYSLLTNINVKSLLSFNVNWLMSRQHNKDYVNKLIESANKLNVISDETIQVRLIQEMNKILGLESTYYKEPGHIEQQCEQIVKRVFNLYAHQDKTFLDYSKEQVEFTKIHHLIHFQLRYLYDEIEIRFRNLSDIDQKEMIHTIYQYILLLPEDKKRLLQERLPVYIISKEDFQRIQLSTFFSVFATIDLPSLFQMLIKILPHYKEELEIKIPFMEDDSLSPIIKLLASPYFITSTVLGGRSIHINYHHHAIKKRMMPLILMLISTTYFCDEGSMPSPKLFLEEWKRQVIRYRQLDHQATVIEMKHIELSEHIYKSRQRVQEYELQKAYILDQLQLEIHKLKSTLSFMNIGELTINESFEKHRAEYYYTRSKLNQLTLSKREEILESSFLKQVTTRLLNMSATLDQFGTEKKADKLLEYLVMDIVHSNSEFKRAERIKIKQIQKELEDMKRLIKKEYDLINEYKIEINKLDYLAKENSEKLRHIENVHYGLKEIAQNSELDN